MKTRDSLTTVIILAVGLSLFPNLRSEEFFRCAFPLDTVKDVSPSGVKVASKFLLQKIVEGQGYTPEVFTPENHVELKKRLQSGGVDGFLIHGHEYLKWKNEIGMEPIVVTSRIGTEPRIPFVMVMKKGASLDDVEGGILNVQNGSGELALMWGKQVLYEKGIDFDVAFGEVQKSENVRKALLPVFFGKADAVICMKSAMDVLIELNPQIEKNLDVVGVSAPMITTLICLRSEFKERNPGQLKRVAAAMHETSNGRNLLNIVGVERFVNYRPEYLDATVNLLAAIEKREAGASPNPVEEE